MNIDKELKELFKKLDIPVKQESNKKVSKCSFYDSSQRSILNNTTQMRIDGRYNGRLV